MMVNGRRDTEHEAKRTHRPRGLRRRAGKLPPVRRHAITTTRIPCPFAPSFSPSCAMAQRMQGRVFSQPSRTAPTNTTGQDGRPALGRLERAGLWAVMGMGSVVSRRGSLGISARKAMLLFVGSLFLSTASDASIRPGRTGMHSGALLARSGPALVKTLQFGARVERCSPVWRCIFAASCP